MVIRKKNLVTRIEKENIDSINQIRRTNNWTKGDFLIAAMKEFKVKLGSKNNYILKFDEYDRTFSNVYSLIIKGELLDEFVDLANKLDLHYTKLFREILMSYVGNNGRE